MNSNTNQTFKSLNDGETDTPTPFEPKKFMGCFSIESGQMIIAGLEAFAFIGQIFNMTYSVRVSLGMLLIFNVPLLTALYLRFKE